MTNIEKKSLRAVIVDDEQPARHLIAQLLAEHDDIAIVGQCKDGRQAISVLRRETPDIVFLDIQIPHFDGFEVLKRLGASRFPLIIFVTAHEQYAVKAFEYHAIDYLLKPFRRERFREALNRARETLATDVPSQRFKRFRSLLEYWEQPRQGAKEVDSESSPQYLQRFFIRSGRSTSSIEVEHVDWIRSVDHFVELHGRGNSYLVYSSIGAVEKKLDPSRFLRVHRTVIINLASVKRFHIEEGGTCVVALCDGSRQRVSRSRQRLLQERLTRK